MLMKQEYSLFLNFFGNIFGLTSVEIYSNVDSKYLD